MALDTILINLTQSLMGEANNFSGPFYKVFFPACYCGGLLMGMKGLMRAGKAAAAGHQAGQVFTSAAVSFTMGVIFIALPSLMGLMLHSAFEPGANGAITSYSGLTVGSSDFTAKGNAIMQAVITLMQALGWIAMVRGLMIIKKVGEGSHQHSVGAGITHLVGAVSCINIVGLAHVIQETVGGELFNH